MKPKRLLAVAVLLAVNSIMLQAQQIGYPEELVTNRFALEEADEAYALMASGKCGKVAVVFDEEIK